MRVLRGGSSVFVFWEDLVYLEASLLASAEAAHLAGLVTAVLATFPGLLQADLDSRRMMVQAEARVAMADAQLDRGLRDTHSDTLHEVRQDRKAAAFTTLFSEDIGSTVKHALARQVEVAATLVEKLVLNLFTPAFREKHQTSLGGLIAAGRTALAGRREARLQRAGINLTVEEWKAEANAVRLGVYAELLKLKGKDFAEQFFRPAPTTVKAKEAEGETPEVPIEG